jgi:hypothetical protein
VGQSRIKKRSFPYSTVEKILAKGGIGRPDPVEPSIVIGREGNLGEDCELEEGGRAPEDAGGVGEPFP